MVVELQIDAIEIFGLTPRSREDLVRLLGTTDPRRLDPRFFAYQVTLLPFLRAILLLVVKAR